MKTLAILTVAVLPLLFFQSNKHPAAYTNTSQGIPIKKIAPSENRKAAVTANALNVRNIPSLSGQVVDQLKYGTKVTVEMAQSGWTKVVSSSGVQGWVYGNYLSPNAPISKQEPLIGKTIVLDPGHGGKDGGTTSISGTPEKMISLAAAKLVGQKLENAGANVIMTRTNDTYIPLGKRANLSNRNHADAFISFHCNWSDDRSVNGVTDFYYQKARDNILARDIVNEVSKMTGLTNDGSKFDDLEVLRNNRQPSTLIELGFLSNKQDDAAAESDSFYDQVAQGVYKGLLDYFQSKNS